MKQPELGKKIVDLRKIKRLTQEELVEKCNISIRTIQRVEAGEVTPRDYTVKMIFTALDYDLNSLSFDDNESNTKRVNWFKTFFLIQVNPSVNQLVKHMHLAWVFGILYFILKFIEGAGDYARFSGEYLFNDGIYATIKVFVIVSYVFFLRGFIIIGYLYDNSLLKIISSLLLPISVLVIGFDIISISLYSIDFEIVIFIYDISYGITGLVFGYALIHLPKSMGRTSKLAGVLEIMTGCFSITVVLSIMGQFLLIPAEILEILVIYRAIGLVRMKEQDKDFAQLNV